jgi:hypothetical protein
VIVTVRSTQSICPYCKGALELDDVTNCWKCDVLHHTDCLEENVGCCIFGCDDYIDDRYCVVCDKYAPTGELYYLCEVCGVQRAHKKCNLSQVYCKHRLPEAIQVRRKNKLDRKRQRAIRKRIKIIVVPAEKQTLQRVREVMLDHIDDVWSLLDDLLLLFLSSLFSSFLEAK